MGRVLLVDDDIDLRACISMALRHEGYDVMTAPHGAAALDLVRTLSPDVIILDLHMPVMDGWEFSRVYYQLPGPHAPIVVTSAGRCPAEVATQLHRAEYVAKPFQVDELIRVVSRYHTS